jgi:hypothetical protein
MSEVLDPAPIPLFDPSDNRSTLVGRAAVGPDRDALAIARHLARLRNFGTASRLVNELDFAGLALPDRCFVGLTMLNAQGGLISDQRLTWQLREIQGRPLAPSAVVRLAEWVQLSGLSTPAKLEHLQSIQVSDGNPDAFKAAQRALRYRQFRLKQAALERVSVLDYFMTGDDDPYQWRDNLRYVNDLVTHGHKEMARRLVEHHVALHGLQDRTVAEAALRFDAAAIIDDFGAISDELRGTPGILGIASDQRSTSPSHEEFFASCLDASMERFPSMDVYAQDTLLRVLATRGHVDELRLLIRSFLEFPDTVLGARCGSGLVALDDEAYRDAAQLLQSVLVEDPAYNAAATGLRFALARLDGGTTVVDLRNQIGYGTGSMGRPGIRTGDRDQTLSLLLKGEYVKSWSARRTAPHWQILKKQYGRKFLNYEPLPLGAASRLFLIADEGVGDEVRVAQFYGEISKHFSVTATCDPRLRPLLSRSFPDIRFIGVARRIRGKLNPVYDGRFSDTFLASHVPKECAQDLDDADHITFGQNLTFNGFAGTIPRLCTGAYLQPDPARAVPRHPEKLKVGLVWRSHVNTGSRRLMYLDIQQLAPLLDVEGVEFWSVQHAISSEEADYCEQHGIQQIEGVDLFDDFDGLAGHLASMDVIIGISTLPMELAAAVGTPTWALGFSPENYYYRTAGGTTSRDQLTRNSTVVAPSWIDFTVPHQDCVDLVMSDCRDRLVQLAQAKAGSGSSWDLPGGGV